MSYEAITYEVKDEVAVVTLNRPEARNALDIRMREEIADATSNRDDENLKAMVLTGAGGAFCGGGDLRKRCRRTGRRRSAVESGSRICIFGYLTLSI